LVDRGVTARMELLHTTAVGGRRHRRGLRAGQPHHPGEVEGTTSADAALLSGAVRSKEVPFSIQRIQTDRGAEFFAEAVQRPADE